MRVLILVAVLLGACGSERPACPARPTPPPGPAFLWKVQRDAGPVVWLFGTIHDAGIELVPPVALAALDGAPRFASELGTGDTDADLRDLMFRRSGEGIDQQLGEDWWDLRDRLRGRIREDQLRRARPWYALVQLNAIASGKTVSMDKRLTDRAEAKAKPIDALETAADQMKVLDAIVTVEDLRSAIRARGTLSCDYQMLNATYARGDVAAMTPMLVVPRTAEPLLYARNRAWLARLEGYLGDGGAFVAVGLGHMLGEQGLPALLAAAGYTVTRIER